jgi:arsenate reductase
MKHVLFVCTHNAGRSQIAKAFWQRHGPDDVRADGAGQEPAAQPWPEVVEAMREVGIDISRERPQKLTVEMQLQADWAITLGCEGTCPYVPTRVEEWALADPHGKPLEEVREIRDDIERHIKAFIATRLDAVRADHTAYQLRLAQLLRLLDDEFAETHPAEEIRACADQQLSQYADAPIRSFVMTLAHRDTRACLREGRCGSRSPRSAGSRQSV